MLVPQTCPNGLISITDSSFSAKIQNFITPLCSRPSGNYIFTGFSEKTSLGCFIFPWPGFFVLVVHLQSKGVRGRPYLFMIDESFKKPFTYYARLITYTLRILFLSMVIMFYNFADCVRIKALWDSFGRQILTQPPVQLSE